jgi:glycosyltransferase involved in cell wall biosynthesis
VIPQSPPPLCLANAPASERRRKISVVIPFYNEVENIHRIYDELSEIRRGILSAYDFEIVFMDNHSTDGSFGLAVEIAACDVGVKVVRLSRNFGYQANILQGYLHSTGDAVLQLDADGEDDPKLIPEFVRHWEEGYKVVYGIRRKRSESLWLTTQRRFFYRLINAISTVPIPVDAGDFRLMDRQVIDALATFKESQIYLRGLIAYAGFSQKGIVYDRRPRFRGVSKFNWYGYVALAWTGISSFSSKPLRIVTWLGTVLSAVSFLGCLFYLALYVVVGVPARGFTTLILVQLLLAGVQLLCVGLMGSYIGFIFEEVKRRPQAFVESVHAGKSQIYPADNAEPKAKLS